MFATLVLISFKAFAAAQLPGAAVGFVIGAFTPAIGRKIKAYFIKEASAVKASVASGVGKVAADVAKKL